MMTGRRPFPTRKELIQSDSQRLIIPQRAVPSTIQKEILDKVMNDAEYQCLMFEVQYPSHFKDEAAAKDFIDKLLARNPDERPRYKGIVEHQWMEGEMFEEESILRRVIPPWVKDHAYLQSRNDFCKPQRRASEIVKYGTPLSECVDNLISDCFEKNDSIYAENFALKWKTKAQPRNLALFRH